MSASLGSELNRIVGGGLIARRAPSSRWEQDRRRRRCGGRDKAVAQLATYETAGADQVIVTPTAAGWERDYAFAGEVRAAL